jgi:YfiR/HmsC-like
VIRRPIRAVFAALAVALALVVALALAGGGARADDAGALALAVKATYLYKFQPFVTWPEQAPLAAGAPFNICIVGNDPFGVVIDRAIAGQTADQHPLAVVRLAAVPGDADCRILYIAGGDPKLALQALAATAGKPVLTVTDGAGDGGAKGMVNFVISAGRVRFEIDDTAARASGLVISSKLLSLAVSVKSAR